MFNSENKENEKREFQKSLDAEQRRRNREDDRLRLRKQDRESRLQQKRRAYQQYSKKNKDKNSNKNSNNNNFSNNNNNNNNNNNTNKNNNNYSNNNNNAFNNFSSFNNNNNNQGDSMKKAQQMLMLLPQYVKGCFTEHPGTQFECAQRIRKLLSIEKNPPIHQVIESGVVPRLVQFLRMDQYDKIQFEAAWALTNIASGNAEHTAAVIRNGAVPVLVSLLNSKSIEVKEQAVWALGNIAGDSPECRNLVLKHKALDNLIPLCSVNVNSKAQLGLLRNATWTLSNFCRGKPQPSWEYVKIALRALCSLLTVPDNEVLQDACWAFSYLSDLDSPNDEIRIDAIVQCGALKSLIKLLGHNYSNVQHPALRAIGNIVTGSDNHTQQVINLGALPKLLNLLDSDKIAIKKEACWTISNITAGTPDQIEKVIEANIIQPLVKIMGNEKFDVQKEAAWAISNATAGGNSMQIRFLVNQGVIPKLCNLFLCDHMRTILVCLEGIENILTTGENDKVKTGNNAFVFYVEECGGLDKLEALQANDKIPDEIFEKAQNIVKQFFDGEEDDDPDNNNNNNNDDDMNNDDIDDNGQFNFNPFNNLNNNKPKPNNNNNNGNNGNNKKGGSNGGAYQF